MLSADRAQRGDKPSPEVSLEHDVNTRPVVGVSSSPPHQQVAESSRFDVFAAYEVTQMGGQP
jgi:hypothetical protein